LQQSDLLAIWESVMDDNYTQPFVQAGDGGGMEAWNQAFAQLARVSQAIDVTKESFFIFPWSGQTNPPASGPQQATVTLTFARTGLLNQPLVLGAGLVWVDDVEPDWSPSGTIQVNTGLRYVLQTTIVFEPGVAGPISVQAVAERPGYGYNNPLAGMLNTIEQPGTKDYNTLAALTNTNAGLPVTQNGIASVQLQCLDVPHVFVPQHVGQYVTITSGTNVGKVARMISYRAANGNGVDGGAVGLEMLVAVHASTHIGTFAVGEFVTVGGGPAAYGVLVDATTLFDGTLAASFVLRCGAVSVGAVVTGTVSGATATVDVIYTDASTFTPTSPTAVPSTESWRVLDWVQDWGLTVTNAAQPTGGLAGTLDLLGKERDVPRLSGEPDSSYRYRVGTIADVDTPKAIQRRLNKLLTQGPLGLSWCLREIGTVFFPGFFFGDGQGHGDFWDYDAQLLSGMGTGMGYQLYEPVTQTVNGVLATGKILIQSLPPTTPFVPGSAATTGVSAGQTLVGVAGVRSNYPFVGGVPIVGKKSGFSSTPSSVTIGPQQRNDAGNPGSTAWRVYVDYLRMRGYFVVTVQRSSAGDFGFAWGTATAPPGAVGGLVDFWDTGPNWNDFYDGSPLVSAQQYLAAYGAVNQIRVAGVLVEFFPANGPCV
jgi:hypothetical protein